MLDKDFELISVLIALRFIRMSFKSVNAFTDKHKIELGKIHTESTLTV